MIQWKPIDEFIEPDWDKIATPTPPTLFWRGKKGDAVFGFIRDGELFDHKWMYVCDANKLTHFTQVNGPDGKARQPVVRCGLNSSLLAFR